MNLQQISRIAWATLRSGPRAVVLTRGAKKRGAKQKTREFAALISLARQLNPRVVVEIGTLHGGTLWTWCQIAHPDALIVSIDLPGGAFGGGYDVDVAATLRGYAKPCQSVVLIRDDSHAQRTQAALEQSLAGQMVDLLFIDGDHTYDGVKLDFEMYGPLVRPGGIIAVHDILHHPSDPDCNVDLFWDILRSTRRHMEFVDRRDVGTRGEWGGIGVVVVEEATPS